MQGLNGGIKSEREDDGAGILPPLSRTDKEMLYALANVSLQDMLTISLLMFHLLVINGAAMHTASEPVNPGIGWPRPGPWPCFHFGRAGGSKRFLAVAQ